MNIKINRDRLMSIIHEEVKTYMNEKKCWPGYERVPGKVSGEPGSCRKK